MGKLWLGCPDCDLAFSSEQEYKHHFGIEHPARRADKARKRTVLNNTNIYRQAVNNAAVRSSLELVLVAAAAVVF